MENQNTITETKGFFVALVSLFAGISLEDVNEVMQLVVLIIGALSGLVGLINGVNKYKKK